MEDPDLLMEQLSANIQLVSKKSARVATLELFRSLSRYTVEYAPAPAFSAMLDACLKLSVALKSSSSNSEENKVIRIVHYYMTRFAHTAPGKDIETAMHFLTGTEVTDKHLPRQMSALATLAVLAQHAAKSGTITDTKGHWATLEPWSKAVFDATTKAGGKARMDKKDVAQALWTAPVVLASTATLLRADKAVTDVVVARLVSGLTLPDPDASRQAAYGLLEAVGIVNGSQSGSYSHATGGPASGSVATPESVAAALNACLQVTTQPVRAMVPAAVSSASGLVSGIGVNTLDPTTVKLVCRAILRLCCGYTPPVTIAAEICLTAAVVDKYYGYYYATTSGPGFLEFAAGVDAVTVAAGNVSDALSPALLLQQSLPRLPGGHPPSSGVSLGQADVMLRWLLTCIEGENRDVSLEAIRILCAVGWDAVLSIPSALETVISQLLETFRGITMKTSLNKCVPTADLMSACRAAICLGESFVMWCVSHGTDSVSNAACKSYADAIASLLPMLAHFAPMSLGWRNKLVLYKAMVWTLPSPKFGRVESDPRIAALIQDTQSALHVPIEREITLLHIVSMLSARVAFTHDLLSVLVTVPLAWCQRDVTSVTPAVCDGLWDFCGALGRPGRVAALSCMFALLDSRPAVDVEDGSGRGWLSSWRELCDSILTYMGRHAVSLCGLPRLPTPAAVPPVETRDHLEVSAAHSIASRLFQAGMLSESSASRETCIQALQSMGPYVRASEKAVFLFQLNKEMA